MFKKDLGSFTRFYEFMSQIVEYDQEELKHLSLYARHLRPMLKEEIDLSSVVLTHYRLAVIESGDAHQNQMMQVLSGPKIADGMKLIIFGMWQD